MTKEEIKKILIQTVTEVLPDFDFLSYKNNCYTFQRQRQFSNLTFYEILYINSNLKDRSFECSIASILNPEYIYSKQYNTGFLNSHIDINVLKHNTGSLNIRNSYYFHNGQVETTTSTIEEIFQDYKKYGLIYLDKQLEELKSNAIIKCGFKYIAKIKIGKEYLKKEITEELKKCGFSISRIKHPIFIDLKKKLQSIEGQTREDRQKISKTALEILELYWAK